MVYIVICSNKITFSAVKSLLLNKNNIENKDNDFLKSIKRLNKIYIDIDF